jgi:alkylation response protein AidB-like acyl-CoA dehydrogenase
VAEDEPDADEQVHMAKAWISEATHRVVAHGQKIQCGIDFTKDYKIQLYFRRQKAGSVSWPAGGHDLGLHGIGLLMDAAVGRASSALCEHSLRCREV